MASISRGIERVHVAKYNGGLWVFSIAKRGYMCMCVSENVRGSPSWGLEGACV